MNDLELSLGHAIRSARSRRKLSQAALASRCGISRRHLAGIESGANFSVAVLALLAAELDELPALVASWLRRDKH
jgi:transcriptional regulator with XRE-family HTH domain